MMCPNPYRRFADTPPARCRPDCGRVDCSPQVSWAAPSLSGLHSGVHDPNRTNTSSVHQCRGHGAAFLVKRQRPAIPEFRPLQEELVVALSMNRIGVVRLGPTIACARNRCAGLGAPMSSGRPFHSPRRERNRWPPPGRRSTAWSRRSRRRTRSRRRAMRALPPKAENVSYCLPYLMV